MKIKKITLKNYKFHHNLSFDITQNNCLIYGENGTGKSSIYKALYSNFYYFKDNKIVTNQINIKEKFIHRDFSNEKLEVNIEFNNNHLNRENNSLHNTEILESQTIYFADEKVFHKITQNDFYQVINSELIKHFPQLEELDRIYRTIRTGVTRSTINEHEDLVRDRQEADRLFKETFHEQVPLDEVNTILHSLDENFEIDFEVTDSDIRFDTKTFIRPKIAIKVKNIDDKGDFKNHFNEAKLKLISIAIYFALAKKYETNSSLKLLVLDDFLTSLDMSNRKLIMWYLLDNFGDYQKIVLTHNLQFYNMIVKLLKIRNENVDWDIKNLFLFQEDSQQIAIMKEKQVDYLVLANEEIINGEYHSSGNYLRKEFERIVHEFKQILEIGKTEKLQNMIDALKSNDIIFSSEPHDLLNQINSYIPNLLGILNSSMNEEQKITKVKELLEIVKVLIDDKKCDLTDMKMTLTKVEFYRNILFNPSSHSDEEIEIYRKECLSSIKLLEELNDILYSLK